MADRQELLVMQATESIKVGDVVSHSKLLQRSMKALEWVMAEVKAGHPTLLVTSTVAIELSSTTQYQ